jgi:lysophospholipase L1-like esterase
MNTKPNAKRILCYGDSLTWGYKPSTKYERLPSNIRWTGKLQKLLGNKYEIIEEGLNSRTLNSEDQRPDKNGRNGSETLIPILDTHDPIDLIILMLGTNELKDALAKEIEDITSILEKEYIEKILKHRSQFRNTTPKLLIISPPPIDISKEYAYERYSQSTEKQSLLTKQYKSLAEKYNCSFINSSEFVSPGSDGVHLDAKNHRKLAKEISKVVKEIICNQ